MMPNTNPDHIVLNTLAEAVRFFCRHLVSLSGWYQTIDSDGNPTGQEQFFSYSGFVISIQGVWNFVTAGHILVDLEEHLQNKTIKVRKYVLVDKFGPDAKSHDPIPFDYENAPKLPVHDIELGLDFGLVMLSPMYRGLLIANGIVPVSEEKWKNIPDDLLNQYIMIGLPQELIQTRVVKERENSKIIGSVAPAGIGIERLDIAPDDMQKTKYPRFVGKLGQVDKSLVNDISGMSGGPIIGFNKQWNQYWIVAVQSSWLPERRITFGCLVSVLAQLVDEMLTGPEPQ
jgi:hypothetical protein